MRYTYSCKMFSIHGASLERFREALESFGLSEKEIGEKIMDCERARGDLPQENFTDSFLRLGYREISDALRYKVLEKEDKDGVQ